jgi:hypothetical protein
MLLKLFKIIIWIYQPDENFRVVLASDVKQVAFCNADQRSLTRSKSDGAVQHLSKVRPVQPYLFYPDFGEVPLMVIKFLSVFVNF